MHYYEKSKLQSLPEPWTNMSPIKLQYTEYTSHFFSLTDGCQFVIIWCQNNVSCQLSGCCHFDVCFQLNVVCQIDMLPIPCGLYTDSEGVVQSFDAHSLSLVSKNLWKTFETFYMLSKDWMLTVSCVSSVECILTAKCMLSLVWISLVECILSWCMLLASLNVCINWMYAVSWMYSTSLILEIV